MTAIAVESVALTELDYRGDLVLLLFTVRKAVAAIILERSRSSAAAATGRDSSGLFFIRQLLPVAGFKCRV